MIFVIQRGDIEMKESRFAINVLLGFLLMGLLWWLPIFGPMIAGYVVGKRSENAKIGAFAAAIPAITIFFIAFSVHQGWISIPITSVNVTWDFTGIVVFLFNTLNAFTSVINNYLYFIHYAPPYFVIMIIFGIIGGALSKNNAQEPRRIRKNIDSKLKHEYIETPRQSPLIKRAIREKKHRVKRNEEEVSEYI